MEGGSSQLRINSNWRLYFTQDKVSNEIKSARNFPNYFLSFFFLKGKLCEYFWLIVKNQVESFFPPHF